MVAAIVGPRTLETAKEVVAITMPPTLLMLADEVIRED